MLEGWAKQDTYNELIVDVANHDEHLPFSVAAILYDAWVHKQFLLFYRRRGIHLTEADVPLVRFDPSDEMEPFQPMRNELLIG